MSDFSTGMFLSSLADEREKQLCRRIRAIANECNCRAKYSADGGEHLLQIEEWLREAIEKFERRKQ